MLKEDIISTANSALTPYVDVSAVSVCVSDFRALAFTVSEESCGTCNTSRTVFGVRNTIGEIGAGDFNSLANSVILEGVVSSLTNLASVFELLSVG